MDTFLERNPDYFKKYYQKNKNKMDTYHKNYCEENCDHIKEYYREYHKTYQLKTTKKISRTKMKQQKIEKMLKLNAEKAAKFKASLYS
jgi:hypothetical protein